MGPPGVLLGPILGPNRGMFSKLDGPGPLGSKGYPHTSFNSGKFQDTYQSFHIGVGLNFITVLFEKDDFRRKIRLKTPSY